METFVSLFDLLGGQTEQSLDAAKMSSAQTVISSADTRPVIKIHTALSTHYDLRGERRGSLVDG